MLSACRDAKEHEIAIDMGDQARCIRKSSSIIATGALIEFRTGF
jgi:hypothetical protein